MDARMSRLPAITATPSVPSDFVSIATTLLAAPAASITVSGIGATYKEFIVTSRVRPVTNARNLLIRPNNDSGPNYNYQGFYANNATVTNDSGGGNSSIEVPTPTLGLTNTAAEGTLTQTVIYKNTAGLEAVSHSISQVWAPGPLLDAALSAHRWNNTTDLISSFVLLASTGNLDTGTLVRCEGLVP